MRAWAALTAILRGGSVVLLSEVQRLFGLEREPARSAEEPSDAIVLAEDVSSDDVPAIEIRTAALEKPHSLEPTSLPRDKQPQRWASS